MTGRVTRCSKTVTQEGAGTSSPSRQMGVAFNLGVSELISWADGLSNKGTNLTGEPSLINERQNAGPGTRISVASQS